MGARIQALVELRRHASLEPGTVLFAAALEAVVLVAAHALCWWDRSPPAAWRRIDTAKRPVRPRR